MRRTVPLVLLLAAVALAGCLGGSDSDPASEVSSPDPTPEVADDWAAQALPFGDGHDHTDPADHANRTTPNFQVQGWSPLTTDYHGSTSGGHLCGEVATEGERDLAVTHSFSTDVAFVVIDVTDPENPEKLGELVLRNTQTYDVAVTDDGTSVALATSPLDTGPDDGAGTEAEQGTRTIQPVWRDTCGNTYEGPETDVPYASGVVLADISDPTAPQVADFEAQPVLGAHSVFATTVDGTDWVLGSTTNLAHSASYFTFFTVESTPQGPTLVERYRHSSETPNPDRDPQDHPRINGHVDGWIQKHPETGDTLAYLANWDGGLVVLDMSDGPPFEVVSQWTDFDPDAGSLMTGNIHEAHPLSTTWDGRHYTFIGQETPERPAKRPTGQVIMLDTTDPANPEPVARWTLPADVNWDGFLQFSTHYLAIQDRTLFVSNYHGGVWAVDADPAAGPELPTLGVFLPTRTPEKPADTSYTDFDWTPTVLDVKAVDDETLFVPDGISGGYTVTFDRGAPVEVPTPDPWTKDAWIGG
jgi:hypothetical protein